MRGRRSRSRAIAPLLRKEGDLKARLLSLKEALGRVEVLSDPDEVEVVLDEVGTALGRLFEVPATIEPDSAVEILEWIGSRRAVPKWAGQMADSLIKVSDWDKYDDPEIDENNVADLYYALNGLVEDVERLT
jgi:hypothetical protein